MSRLNAANTVERVPIPPLRLSPGRIRRFSLLGQESIERNHRLGELYSDQPGDFWADPETPDHLWLKQKINENLSHHEGDWDLAAYALDRLTTGEGMTPQLPFPSAEEGRGLVCLYVMQGPSAAQFQHPKQREKFIRTFRGVMLFFTDDTPVAVLPNEEQNPHIILWSLFHDQSGG